MRWSTPLKRHVLACALATVTILVGWTGVLALAVACWGDRIAWYIWPWAAVVVAVPFVCKLMDRTYKTWQRSEGR